MFLVEKHTVHEEVLFVHKHVKRLIHSLYFLSLIFILLLMIIRLGLDFTYG